MKPSTTTLQALSLGGLITVSAAVMFMIGLNCGRELKNTPQAYELVGDDCIEDEEGFQSVSIYQTKSADTTYIVTVEKIVRQ